MSEEKYTTEDLPAKDLTNIISNNKTEYQMDTKEVTVPDSAGINYGIEETKDVVGFGVSLANSIVKALDDGKISLGDIESFISPITKIPAAISGISQVPAEVKDIDETELSELIAYVKENIDVDDEHALNIVQQSLTVVYDIYNLIKLF